jgi:hypothetical protein
MIGLSLSENWDPRKLGTAQEVGRRRDKDDPQCKNGTRHGTRVTEARRRQPYTENLERTKKNKRLKNTKRKSVVRGRRLKQQQWQLRGKAGIKEPHTRRQLRLRIKRTSDRIDGKTFRLEMVKRANETSSWLRRIGIWTLWRGRPPPELKKSCKQNKNRICGCGSTGHSTEFQPPLCE